MTKEISTLEIVVKSLKDKENIGMVFLVETSIVGLLENRRSIVWEGCGRCKVKYMKVGSAWNCLQSNINDIKPKFYMVLKVDVRDSSSEPKFQAWEGVAEQMIGLSTETFRAAIKRHDEELVLLRLIQPKWKLWVSIQKSRNNQHYVRIDGVESREEKEKESKSVIDISDSDSDMLDFTPESQRSFQKWKQHGTVKIENPLYDEADATSEVESSSVIPPTKTLPTSPPVKKRDRKSTSREEDFCKPVRGREMEFNKPVRSRAGEFSKPASGEAECSKAGKTKATNIHMESTKATIATSKAGEFLEAARQVTPVGIHACKDGTVIQAFGIGFLAGSGFSIWTLAPAMGFAGNSSFCLLMLVHYLLVGGFCYYARMYMN